MRDTDATDISLAGVLTASASRIGPVTSASHHVVISIYMFFCMCGDAVSQAAQSFLPGVVRLLGLHVPFGIELLTATAAQLYSA